MFIVFVFFVVGRFFVVYVELFIIVVFELIFL